MDLHEGFETPMLTPWHPLLVTDLEEGGAARSSSTSQGGVRLESTVTMLIPQGIPGFRILPSILHDSGRYRRTPICTPKRMPSVIKIRFEMVENNLN